MLPKTCESFYRLQPLTMCLVEFVFHAISNLAQSMKIISIKWGTNINSDFNSRNFYSISIMPISCQLLQFSKNVDGTVNIRWRFLLIWRLFDSFFHMHDVWLVQSSLKMSFWWVNRTPSPFWVVVIFGPFDRFCHHSKSTAEMKRK